MEIANLDEFQEKFPLTYFRTMGLFSESSGSSKDEEEQKKKLFKLGVLSSEGREICFRDALLGKNGREAGYQFKQIVDKVVEIVERAALEERRLLDKAVDGTDRKWLEDARFGK